MSQRQNQDSVYTNRKKAWGALAVLFVIYMSDYADRAVLASMIDFIKAEWKISDARAGWLISVVLLFITIFSLPSSILIDRWSRRKMVSIMTFVWSLATLACAFTRNYWQLLAARALVGIGEAGYSPGGAALLSGAFPERERARVLGIWNAAIPLGVGVGMAAGGIIAKKWGWHHAFGIVALPGMVLAIAAWFLPDYKTVKSDAALRGGPAGLIADAKRLFQIPSLRLIYLGFAMNVSCTTAMITWLPSYFERGGLVEQGRGGAMATPFFALVIVGTPLGGFLADAWQKRRPEARLLLPAISSLMAAVFLLAAFSSLGRTNLQLGFLTGYGLVIGAFIAPSLAASQDVVHPALRAFAMGMCVFTQHALGDVWSPPAIGLASDHLGLPAAMFFIPGYGVAASVAFFFASRHYARDLEKVERVALEPE